MGLSVSSPTLEQSWASSSRDRLDSTTESLYFFKTIPPERIGLNGEYDHSGLAKRVIQRFRQHFLPQHLEQLSVTQRGAVVILSGRVTDRQTLDQMIEVALGVIGTWNVEYYRVQVGEH